MKRLPCTPLVTWFPHQMTTHQSSTSHTPAAGVGAGGWLELAYSWIAQSPTKVGPRISDNEDLIFCIDMYISKDAKWGNRSGLKIRKSFGQRGLRI